MAAPTAGPTPDVLRIIDADTHWTEPGDLWTSRVPEHQRELVPHLVQDGEGTPVWLVNGDEVLAKPAGGGSVIRRDGSKIVLWDWNIEAGVDRDEISPASYDVTARLEMMDRLGIWAQIVYPNTAGFGAHKLAKLPPDVGRLTVQVYNDAMAELQEQSGNRLFPQALVPFWDIDAAVAEVERARTALGLTGITMCSEPHAGGLPDLVERHWDPLWEACQSLDLPINFHVGASEFGMETFMKSVWPSLDHARRIVVGSVQIELHNARILSNLLVSDLLVRFPGTKWVSVESGIGWIPYVIERLEYQLLESGRDGRGLDQPSPKELFQRQVYGMFWFEDLAPRKLLQDIGVDNVMFETDFPHPTCLYPSAREHALEVTAHWGAEVQRKVLHDNAVRVYGLPV